MSLTPGTRLGRYEIRGRLGAGGMAEVYLAEDSELGRRVALKLLPPETTADAHAQRRLLREARAAASLEHPHICPVYDIGEDNGQHFIAMQYIEGETLDNRMRRQRLSSQESIALAVDVADALADAHARGIVHRDIKPSNVMVTARGGAVVLDFGLAKPRTDDGPPSDEAPTESLLSAPGVVLGTVPYMSPEQVRGEATDGRSDIFSLGVMLYEMVAGQRPFGGKTSAATAAAILTHEPAPLPASGSAVPGELARIVTKTLRKDADQRYQTAKDLLVDLRALAPQPVPVSGATPASSRRSTPMRLVALVVIALGVAGWYGWRQVRLRAAAHQVSQLEGLVQDGRLFEAFDVAIAAERVLPGDPTLARLMPAVAFTISVKTDPAGASLYLRRFAPDAEGRLPERELVGLTPIADLRIARGEYVLSIEKPGFSPVDRTISGVRMQAGGVFMAPPPLAIDLRLLPASERPPNMVFVPAGDYRLVAWSRPTDRRERLDDFFIDTYEVTNREYKEFISAGGYLKREFWKVPIVRDGRALRWEDAMKLFVDRSGLPGPRSWTSGDVPEGKADHPVTDVTWYEAAAYAVFRGKRLPTVFEWEKTARDGAVASLTNFMPWGVFYPGKRLDHHANFDNGGTVPVTHLEFGMSPFGAYNMAGNVAEWTMNETSEGMIATGGAWGEYTYAFAQYPMYPPFYSSAKLGFRCALSAPGTTGSQGATRIEISQETPVYQTSTAAEFGRLRTGYDYAATPLEARVEAVIETPDWRRERITFAGMNGERAIAYLYLPRHFPRPLQVINFVPAGDVERGLRALPDSLEDRLRQFVKSGRAAFGVVLKGYSERLRPDGTAPPAIETVEYFEALQQRIIDLRRGLDYLVTRPEIDRERIAFFGPSAGAQIGIILAAVEPRYRAVAFIGSGIHPAARNVIAAANPINFAGHILPPKLMLQGKYDEDTPLRAHALPLYVLLPQPKRLLTFEGGHVPPDGLMFSTIAPFFDEFLGPVKR